MKTKQVSFSKGFTVNIGNFESVRIDVSMTVELENGDTEFGAFKKASEYVENQLATGIEDIKGIIPKSSTFHGV